MYQLCTKFIIFAKKTGTMTKKKDLYNLHCRVKHSTIEKLKAWSEELGLSLGEEIDQVVENYEDYCKKEDEVLEKTDLHDILEKLLEKVERIEKKIGMDEK